MFRPALARTARLSVLATTLLTPFQAAEAQVVIPNLASDTSLANMRARLDSILATAAMQTRTDLIEAFRHPVLFGFDSSDLNVDAVRALRGTAELLRDAPFVILRVEGHTDERGDVLYNLALGARRAQSVRDFLVEQGVRPEQLSVISQGEQQPRVMGSAEASWTLNRRAEFDVSFGEAALTVALDTWRTTVLAAFDEIVDHARRAYGVPAAEVHSAVVNGLQSPPWSYAVLIAEADSFRTEFKSKPGQKKGLVRWQLQVRLRGLVERQDECSRLRIWADVEERPPFSIGPWTPSDEAESVRQLVEFLRHLQPYVRGMAPCVSTSGLF